jgi:hypothetical protein
MKKLPAFAVGALIVGSSILGTATAANAWSYVGGFTSRAQCISAAGNYEFHGHVILMRCSYHERLGDWFFAVD